MANISNYEENRLKRLEENKKRMEALKTMAQSLHKPKSSPMKRVIPKVPREALDPSSLRRSTRFVKKPAINYKEPYVRNFTPKAVMADDYAGTIFVTLPKDHFGPIPAENDPARNQGVLVGETWAIRKELRQWGVHCYATSDISGKAHIGAQSIVTSGGYGYDKDNGEWFIYTGSSGSRDLTGNKRTKKKQYFDQEFEEQNQALMVSCIKGYPVRVVRSEKDEDSPYAPEKGYRYDGIYRIEKCWRRTGIKKMKVCRYLFVRCDNEPAPWSSDEHGNRPGQLPNIPELERSTDVFERTETPSWDYDEVEGCWKWKKPPPVSEEKLVNFSPKEMEDLRKAYATLMKKKLLKEFNCLLCEELMSLPMTTPCGHNYCKPCLETEFAGWKNEKERVSVNGRRLRTLKNEMKCPSCSTDISEFFQNPQVNMHIKEEIEKLQSVSKDGTGSTPEETESSDEDSD